MSQANSIHVVFDAECKDSVDWMSIAIFHSFRTSGWKGKITRLLACSPEQKQIYKGMNIGPTFVLPNYEFVEEYGDSPTYNKPAALMHFTKEENIEEEFLLYVNANFLFRRVIDPEVYRAKRGHIITEYTWYIRQGIFNGLADQFLKDSDARERAKTTHGGYYYLMQKDDAKALAPLWLHYTREMRQHPERYWADLDGSTLEKDIDTVQMDIEPGQPPWQSYMYGYAFAAAELGLTHSFTRGGGGVLYSDDFLTLNHAGPFATHYSLACRIPSTESFVLEDRALDGEEDGGDEWVFDKNEYTINSTDCKTGGWLDDPPRSPLADEASASCLESVERINHALCDYYRKNCPTNSFAYTQSYEVCPHEVNGPYLFHYYRTKAAPCGNREGDGCNERAFTTDECRRSPQDMTLQCLKSCNYCMPEQIICQDEIPTDACEKYAEENECVLNPTYMNFKCRKTCNACEFYPIPTTGVSRPTIESSPIVHVVNNSSAAWISLFTLSVFSFALFFVWLLFFGGTSYIDRKFKGVGLKKVSSFQITFVNLCLSFVIVLSNVLS